MKTQTREALSAVLVHELVPALGCTEPIAVAFCSAAAVNALGEKPEKLLVEASSNIVKNVKSVVVPNSGGLKGIPAAALLGALAHQPDLRLEVLKVISSSDQKEAADLLQKGICSVKRLETDHPLHIIVHAYAGTKEARAEVMDEHTNLVSVTLNGKPVEPREDLEDHLKSVEKICQIVENPEDILQKITLKDLIEYVEDNDFGVARAVLQNQIATNAAISDEGLAHPWGIGVGRYHKGEAGEAKQATDARGLAIAMASAGSDARMSGCDLPVVINSGSGNQGMVVSMPILAYARVYNIGPERMIQALALSNLIALYQKSRIGRLSAFCGAVTAATGAACGVAWMLDGDLSLLEKTIKNTLGTIAGIVCDGAKPSCAAKIAAAISQALDSYEWAKKGVCFEAGDGLVKNTADETIEAVGRMARLGMRATDAEIIDIMLEQSC